MPQQPMQWGLREKLIVRPAKYNSFILAPAVKAQISLEIGRNGFLLNQEMRHFIFVCSTVPVPLPVVWPITFFYSSSKDESKKQTNQAHQLGSVSKNIDIRATIFVNHLHFARNNEYI